MNPQIYLVCGTEGDYDERTEWRVDGYTDESTAKARVAELDGIRRELDEWITEHNEKQPNVGNDSPESEWKKWEAWEVAHKKGVARFVKKSGDKQLHQRAHYWVETINIVRKP